jgi:hypothetical protein
MWSGGGEASPVEIEIHALQEGKILVARQVVGMGRETLPVHTAIKVPI